MKHITLGRAEVVDVVIRLTGSHDIRVVSTIAHGYDELDVQHHLKYFFKMYLDAFTVTESSGSAEWKKPQLTDLNPNVNHKIKSYVEFDVNGKITGCVNNTLKLHGIFGRSSDRQKYLLERPEAQECTEADENTYVACDKINILADVYDQLNVSIMLEKSKFFKSNILAMSGNIEKFFPEVNVETNELKPLNKYADRVDSK